MSPRHHQHHAVPVCPCPSCGRANDAATNANDAKARPKKGDVSICFYCGEILEFGDDLQLHKAVDMTDWPADTIFYVHRMQKLIRAHNAQRVGKQ